MKRVLIIDDDEEMCFELSHILKHKGFEVDVALDGLRGWEYLECGNHQLVILDLKLPGLNGYEVLKTIKASRRPVKIIVLSGYPLAGALAEIDQNHYKEKEETLKMADAVMSKPFVLDVFFNKIHELMADE